MSTDIQDDLSIPDFLKIDAETRKQAWVGRKVLDARTGQDADAWRVRELERRELIEAERSERNKASLARLKDEHAGERYDRKTKTWVRDPTVAAKAREAEFTAHTSEDIPSSA